jgi:glycosyltransferase involved in cell wall biosynthesis
MEKIDLTCLICVYSVNEHYDKLLLRALDSIEQQTYKNFKVLIVLDRCHNETLKTINDKKYWFKIDTIKNDKEGGGLSFVKNMGIDLIDTEYTTYLDADDFIDKNKFEKQIDFMKNNPNIDVTSTMGHTFKGLDTENLYEDPYIVNQYETNEQILKRINYENMIYHGSVMVKTKILKENKYNSNFYRVEDWELWRRLLSLGYVFHIIQERLYYYSLDSTVK